MDTLDPAIVRDFVDNIERSVGHSTTARVAAELTGATLVVESEETAAELRRQGVCAVSVRKAARGDAQGPLIIDPEVLRAIHGYPTPERERRGKDPRRRAPAPSLEARARFAALAGIVPTPDEEGLSILFRKAQPHRTVVEFVDDNGIVRMEEVQGASRADGWVAVSTASGPARFPKGLAHPVIRRLFDHNGDEIWNAQRWM